jgi:hypothetical protein
MVVAPAQGALAIFYGSFPGVAFRKIDETTAWVEFSLAWSPQSEYAVIGRFLASMRASAADKGVDASAS